MNPPGLAAFLRLPGMARSLPATPQRESWSHVPTTAPTEPNAASPKNSASPHLTVCGDAAALTAAWSGIAGPNGHLPAKAAMEVGPGATHPWQIIAA